MPNGKPTLVDLLFPPRCIVCRKLTGLEEHICPECARNLSYTGSQTKQKGDFFDGCYSPFFYEEPLRASFLRYKFNGFRQYSKLFGKWMADCLISQGETDFDFITWAPLNRVRKLFRGYDQAQLLAQHIATHLSLEVRPTLKKAYRRPLSRLEGNKAVRSARVLGAYSVLKHAQLAGKRVLLVDDVITSGATMSECARMLKTAGAAKVVGVTLLRKRSN